MRTTRGGRAGDGVGSAERSIRLARTRRQRLIFDALLLGVAGAAGAQLFTLLLRAATSIFLTHLAGYRPPGLPNEGGTLEETVGAYGRWLIPVAITLGGLIVGS